MMFLQSFNNFNIFFRTGSTVFRELESPRPLQAAPARRVVTHRRRQERRLQRQHRQPHGEPRSGQSSS